MKIIERHCIALLIALGCSNSAYAEGSLIPIITLLLGETPAIYRCESKFLKDLNGPGNGSYAVKAQFTNLGNRTLFFADHPVTGTEPWVTDGTPAGTHILKDINSGSSNGIGPSLLSERLIERLGNKAYFLANDGANGEELWITDGTSNGTRMVKNITGNDTTSFISNLTPFNGKMYFLVANGAPGVQDEGLWVSEGTNATTRLVRDIHPSSGGISEAGTMVVLNNRLLFRAYGGQDSRIELWQSNGSSGGTSLLKDINPSGSSFPEQFTVVGDKAYFIADDGTHGKEVWVSDGSSGGTRMVKDIYPGSTRGAMGINIDDKIKKNPGFGNKLYFVGRTAAQGDELWVTDGTPAGTQLVRDIYSGSNSAFDHSSSPLKSAEVFNGKFYFQARDQAHGIELWRVNENGSTTLRGLDSGSSHSTPEYLTANDNFLFFQSRIEYQIGAEPTIMDKDGRIRQLNIFSGPRSSYPKYLHIRNDQSLLFVTVNGQFAPGVGLYQVKCPAG